MMRANLNHHKKMEAEPRQEILQTASSKAGARLVEELNVSANGRASYSAVTQFALPLKLKPSISCTIVTCKSNFSLLINPPFILRGLGFCSLYCPFFFY